MASSFKKYLNPCNFFISSVARGSVLATGFRQLFISASIVTRYDVGGVSFVVPGSLLGTMTSLEKHLGSSHLSTTGVVLTKCSKTLQVAGLPWYCPPLIVGSGLGLLPVVYWSCSSSV